MDDLSLPEVRRLLAAANAVRRQRDASASALGSGGHRAERRLYTVANLYAAAEASPDF